MKETVTPQHSSDSPLHTECVPDALFLAYTALDGPAPVSSSIFADLSPFRGCSHHSMSSEVSCPCHSGLCLDVSFYMSPSPQIVSLCPLCRFPQTTFFLALIVTWLPLCTFWSVSCPIKRSLPAKLHCFLTISCCQK
jgi:hypothetical protein